MGTIEQGVKQAVENCLKVQAGENVVIITDKKTLEIGSAFKKAIERITGKIQFFIMEDFGQRPIDFPHAIESTISIADVSIYAAHFWRLFRSRNLWRFRLLFNGFFEQV